MKSSITFSDPSTHAITLTHYTLRYVLYGYKSVGELEATDKKTLPHKPACMTEVVLFHNTVWGNQNI